MKTLTTAFKSIITALFFLIVLSNYAYADWTNLNTGIDDDFTGVVFFGDNGALSGKKGIYYTTNGGNNPADWLRYNIENNSSDSIIYNNTSFNHCFSDGIWSDQKVFACGQDTVNNKAVIASFDLETLTFELIYYGASNTSLNHIGYAFNTSYYYAVGDDGLIIKVTPFDTEEISTSITYDLTFFTANGYNFWMGANGAKIQGTDIFSFNVVENPDPLKNYKDGIITGTYESYGVGNGYFISSPLSSSSAEGFNYDLGPLEGNCISKFSSRHFIGTEHGIYKSFIGNESTFEFFPSTATYQINEFYENSSNDNIYACGDNGTLLVTSDLGGLSKPYNSISQHDGGCINSSHTFTSFNGSATNCLWYVNGQYHSAGCGSKTIDFDDLGSTTVTIISSNDSYSDTASTSFYIVDRPEIDKPVSISDGVLCKEESIDITLDDSQLNVVYELRKFGNSIVYGISQEGDGGTINFTTDMLNEAGNYYLKAASSIASCTLSFSDTIPIIIEKTKANFHSTLINAKMNENVEFIEQCSDSDNYNWTFGTNASVTSSNLTNVSNSFNSIGNTEVKLVCSSNNGCFDSITKPGPTIYESSTPLDSCWVNHNAGPDPLWGGYYHPDINQISLSTDGYFISGSYSNTPLVTQEGDSLDLTFDGGYMAKYDPNGVLKWTVSSKTRVSISNSNTEIIKSVVEDTSGNVYICGTTQGWYDYFFDNTGDSVFMEREHFLMKLDSLGKIIWRINSNEFKPTNIFIDHAQNLIVSANLYQTSNIYLNKNGEDFYTIPGNGLAKDFEIIKFSPDGDVIWHMGIEIYASNGENIASVGVDSSNNIYVTGKYEHFIKFHEIGGTGYNEILGWPGEYGAKLYLAKFDSDGNYLWGIRSSTRLEGDHRHAYPYDMVTDVNGNCYISGTNESGNTFPGYVHAFDNTNSTTTSIDGGQFFIAKIDNNGICKWIQANDASSYGAGYNISLVGNELSVLGSIFNNGSQSADQDYYFTSANNNGIELTIHQADYFINVYDTLGNIKKTITNGINDVWGMFDTYTAPGLINLENGGYLFARNSKTNGNQPYQNFDSEIIPNSNRDGIVTKFKENCGITYYPGVNIIDTVIVCMGTNYTFPDGSIENNITTRIYHDSHLLNQFGQDSTVVTMVDTTSSFIYTDTVFICSGENYSFPDNSIENDVMDTIVQASLFIGAEGCDSIIRTTLIPISMLTVITESVCRGSDYTFLDGTTANSVLDTIIYDFTLTSNLGCDSVIRTMLLPWSYLETDYQIICKGDDFVFPDDSTITNISSFLTYESTLLNELGCDSIIITEISFPIIDTTVVQNGHILTANQLDAEYQWVNCSDYSEAVNGENRLFVPLNNGDYVVIITYDGCSDTSACYTVSSIGIDENSLNQINVFPNPSNNDFSIDLGNSFNSVNMDVFDLDGRLIKEIKNFNGQFFKLNLNEPAGFYVLKINSSDLNAVIRIEILP